MALPVKNRLNNKRDFETVFKEGKTGKGSFLFIRIAPNNRPVSRFGFVVPAKAAKKAVLRNKIRRDLSELIRLNMGKISGGYDIIVIIRNGAVSTDVLKDDLKEVLKRLKITI